MRTFWRALCAVVVLIFLLATWRLGRLQRLGPPHFDTTLDGGVPATVYIPGKPGSFAHVPFPLPAGERWPVVVLLHGYSADRASMSTLARRLSQNGIAVISIEFAGHGMNRNPFSHGETDDTLVKETMAAVDYARALPLFDASRIVVMGHSMGAGTALDYAQHDNAITGSASSDFTPYRRKTLRIARSRSPAAFSTAWRRRRNSDDSLSIRPLSPFC